MLMRSGLSGNAKKVFDIPNGLIDKTIEIT